MRAQPAPLFAAEVGVVCSVRYICFSKVLVSGGSSNWVEVRWMVGWGWANVPECLTGLLSSCECLAFSVIAEYSDIDVAAKSKGF